MRDVDVGPDEKKSLGDRHPAVGIGSFVDALGGEGLLVLLPELDPFEECSAIVLADFLEAEDGVEVEVTVDKGGEKEISLARDGARTGGFEGGGDRDNFPVANSQVLFLALVQEARFAQNQIVLFFHRFRIGSPRSLSGVPGLAALGLLIFGKGFCQDDFSLMI